ncbi:MAG: Multi-sensor hybrid histidine kinase [Hyphomicrobiales bacterium]|nr:Multi-sensor hybrid histidine kinase [Hyphomicrobiales bacterium]
MTSLMILLADDDPLVRGVIAEEIEEAGHHVRSVRSGPEALEALQGEPFDVFLVDYAMPGMMGIEVAERARDSHPQLPIAILTGYGDLLEISGRQGNFPVIAKGRMEAMLSAIVAVAGGESLPPPSSPESRWEAIQRRMAVTANSQLVGETLRSLYNEPSPEPMSDQLEAFLGEAPKPAGQPATASEEGESHGSKPDTDPAPRN